MEKTERDDSFDLSMLVDQLFIHEGCSLDPYSDHLGYLTIGVGRCLDKKGISEEEAMILLMNDIDEVADQLDRNIPWWRDLDDVRQRVLLDMGFNLGAWGLMKFRKFLTHLQGGRYNSAANEMLNSKWAGQVKGRATALAQMMRSGKDYIKSPAQD